MTLAIGCGDLRCVVRPEVGGSIAGLHLGAEQILRSADLARDDANTGGCFPFVPFSNRILDGRFKFGAHDLRLESTVPGIDRVVHGLGWRAAWTVAEQSAASVSMLHRHLGGRGWTWPYDARQTVEVLEDRLRLTLSVRNRGTESMPLGLGWHPFFLRTPETLLIVHAQGAAEVGPENMPAPCRDEAALLRQLGAGWKPDRTLYLSGVTGEMRLVGTARSIVLAVSADLDEAVFYLAPDGGFVCLEPTTHRVGALNTVDPFAGRGPMRRLEPETEFGASMEIRIE